MTENEIREHFEKVGYKGRSIVDVWFQNWDKIRSDLERRHPTLSQKIETHIRWKTDTGKKVLAEVLTYIEIKKSEYQANFKIGSRDLLKLDLNEVLVDGKTINEYFYSNVKHASEYSGWVDLSGIPLRDTRISNAVICNAQLSNADFSNSVLQVITFVNCNLSSCSFENAHVAMLRFKGGGGLANSNWTSASVNSIDISANQFGDYPEFIKIGYFQLIKVALTRKVPYRAKYTDFSRCYLKVESEEDSAQVKSVKEYISWYQDTVNKYTYRSRNLVFDSCRIICPLVVTKFLMISRKILVLAQKPVGTRIRS